LSSLARHPDARRRCSRRSGDRRAGFRRAQFPPDRAPSRKRERADPSRHPRRACRPRRSVPRWAPFAARPVAAHRHGATAGARRTRHPRSPPRCRGRSRRRAAFPRVRPYAPGRDSSNEHPRFARYHRRMSADDDSLLADQVAYYRARAGEYDQWWFRQGRFDRGPELNAAFFADVAIVEGALFAFLDAVRPRRVLELACGTGLFTRHLAPHVAHVTAVDASPEVIACN